MDGTVHRKEYRTVASGAGKIVCSCGWQSQVMDDGRVFEETRDLEKEFKEHIGRANAIKAQMFTVTQSGKTYDLLRKGEGEEAVSAILCRRCLHVSFNSNDIAQRYCGYCHDFHEGGSK